MNRKDMILLLIILVAGSAAYPQQEKDPCFWKIKNIYLSFPSAVHPQTTGWKKIESFSDEFEGNSLDPLKWEARDYGCHPMSPMAYFRENNVSVERGNLTLFVRNDPDGYYCRPWDSLEYNWYYYSSGYIASRNAVRYGYFEMECYLPSNPAMMPSFWMVSIYDSARYDEIDIFERTGKAHETATLTQNIHHNLEKPGRNTLIQLLHFDRAYLGQWNRYGMEWLPEEIRFYVNGNLTSSVKYINDPAYGEDYTDSDFSCTNFIHALPQSIRISLSLGKEAADYPDFSESFKINYVRSYKMEEGFDFQYRPVKFDISNPNMFKVHKSIRLGGGTGYTAIIPESQNITIWAKEEIILDKGFTITGNTEFAARVIKTDSDLFINND